MPEPILLDQVLTVDPGYNTGWAYWKEGSVIQTGLIRAPVRADCKTIVERLDLIWSTFALDCFEPPLAPRRAIIESVELWGGSAKSQMSAQRGDLMSLSYCVGGLMEICLREHIKVSLVPALKWKGQLPNSALKLRIKRAIDMEFPSEHIDCAVGIGLAEMGML
jgi:hypothetical protein